MLLTEFNGKVNFSVTISEQNTGIKQGEICFMLKSYKDNIFEFENHNHDFPKIISYDFSGYDLLNARVEGREKSFTLKYKRIYDISESFSLTGNIIKEPFVNKAGRIIDNVYDYFYEIQGEKYFKKLSAGSVNQKLIEANLNETISTSITICTGLWDTDDNTHQSRIGKYFNTLKILN